MDETLRIQALHRDDWRKYESMVDKLIKQLSPNASTVTREDFFDAVGQDEKNFTVFIIRHAYGPKETPEGEFIGMATIFYRHLLSGWIGEIHDVVVDNKYFRQGYGRLLTQHIFADAERRAKDLGRPIKLMLTSKPARTAANSMYLQAGFKMIAESATFFDGHGPKNVEGATNLYMKIINP